MLETVFDNLLFTLFYKKSVQRCPMHHSFLCLGLLTKCTVLVTIIYDLSSKLYIIQLYCHISVDPLSLTKESCQK